MRKRIIAKGNIHRSDYLRTLVTDTLPGDIPIIISNDGFYRNLGIDKMLNENQREFAGKILNSNRSYTFPYRYNILKAGGGARRLSLTHPSAQMEVARFYRDFGNLICYYCRKSEASIRSPEKVGSLFFVRGALSEANKLKGPGIDTTDIESSISNPASYFTYRGYNRAYKFFNSNEYMRLEKRYSVMYFADVAKCFTSIYTHTIFWAVADVQTAKDNTASSTFSNSFDRLMQSMNFNETNGICVGAEVSRVFAEVILSEVDRRVISIMKKHGLKYRSNYEFKRYVDDYYLFTDNDQTSRRLISAIELALADFNMHLNEGKLQKVDRPFITKKSRIVRDANINLNAFFERFIGSDCCPGGTYIYPKKIWRSASLLRSLLESIKSTCFDHAAGYDGVSNYIIGALASRVRSIIGDCELGLGRDGVTSDEYLDTLVMLLEGIYFFYNVNPTLPSSLKVAQAAIQAANFVEKYVPERSAFLSEQLVRWTFQFIKSLSGSTIHAETASVPLEALNILIVLGEVGKNDIIASKAIVEFCGSVKALNYFEIVSFLFCMKDDAKFASLRNDLVARASAILREGLGIRVDAQAAHLSLDLLACPFVDSNVRADLFSNLRANVGLAPISKAKALAAVKAFEDEPWFVNWKETDLLRMIRKKELSDVY